MDKHTQEVAGEITSVVSSTATKEIEQRLNAKNLTAEQYVQCIVEIMGNMSEHYMSMAMTNIMFNTDPLEWKLKMDEVSGKIADLASGAALSIVMNKDRMVESGQMVMNSMKKEDHVNFSNTNNISETDNVAGGSVTHIRRGEGQDQSGTDQPSEPSSDEGADV